MLTFRSQYLIPVYIFFSILFISTWGIYSQEVIGFDSRFYLFALEMWQNGFTWFPTTYQEPYPDYPVTSTLMIYVCALLYGGMNKLVAILPAAIAASITVTLTYLIGALHDKRLGLYAVLFMILTIGFIKSARALSLDMYPAAITTACFYLIHRASLKAQSSSIIALTCLLIIGFVFRGPLGLIIPAGVVCTYYLLEGNIKRLLFYSFFALLLLMICTTALLALAYHIGGNIFMQDVLRMEIWGRFSHASPPLYFYFTNSLGSYALTYPIACLMVGGSIYYTFTNNGNFVHRKLILKLAGWIVIILIGMSLPGDKKPRYILAMAPAIALISAYLFITSNKLKYFVILRRIIIGIFTIFPSLLLLGTICVFYYASKMQQPYPINYFYLSIFFISFQGVNHFIRRTQFQELSIGAIAGLCFVVAYIYLVEPIELYLNQTKNFVITIEKLRSEKHKKLVFYKEKSDGIAIKYLINMPQRERPLFIDSISSLIKTTNSAIFITSIDSFSKLPKIIVKNFKVIKMGHIGHLPVIVFVTNIEKANNS